MRIFALTASILAAGGLLGLAWGDTYPSRIDGLGGGGDSLEMHVNERGIIELVYSNTVAQRSMDGVYTLSLNGVVVDARIEVGGNVGGAEVITVTTRDPGMFAEPYELDVLDGEVGRIIILPAIF